MHLVPTGLVREIFGARAGLTFLSADLQIARVTSIARTTALQAGASNAELGSVTRQGVKAAFRVIDVVQRTLALEFDLHRGRRL